jgi:transcriptional regulator with AAA-type ATPase domain
VKDSKNKHLKMKGLFATHSPFYSTNSIIVSEFLHKVTWAIGFHVLAFNGADASRGGKLEAADNGPVLFYETADMSAYGQGKSGEWVESKKSNGWAAIEEFQ